MKEKNFDYKVRECDELTFEVKIGHGQPGVSTISIGDQILASAAATSYLKVKLPFNGKDLTNKVLSCFSTVQDIQINTNYTSVTYSLEGGPESLDETLTQEVDSSGERINYSVDFYFHLS